MSAEDVSVVHSDENEGSKTGYRLVMKLVGRLGISSKVALTAILLLTIVWVVLSQEVAVPQGFSVTVYPSDDADGPPLLEATVSEVSLDVLDQLTGLPPNTFTVRWLGYWFVSRDQTVVITSNSGGRTTVIVDGRRVVRHASAEDSGYASGTVTLEQGSHQVVVEYTHHSGVPRLHLEWAPRGQLHRPLVSSHFFTRRLDLEEFRFTRSIYWFGWLLVAVLIALPILSRVPIAGHRLVRMPMSEFRWRLGSAAFPAMFAPLQVFMFGTHTIFEANATELGASFLSLAASWSLLLAVIIGGLLTLAMLVNQRYFRRYVVWLVGLGLIVWLQGGVMGGNYGVFDGQEPDWSGQRWRVTYEVAFWTTLPLIMVFFTKALFSTARFVSQILIALQLVVLLGSAFGSESDGPHAHTSTLDWIFEFSRSQNVIHIVLDGFQSDVFHEMVEDDPRLFNEQFSGFVFFADHAGAFPTTVTSIPAMLTGAVYRNQESLKQFIRRQSLDRSLLTVLQDHGYETDAISIHTEVAEGATNRYRIPKPFTDYRDYVRFAGWQLLDLSLFRHSPHLLKPWIYNNQSWRLQARFGQGENEVILERRHHAANGHAFLEELVRRADVSREVPVYKFVHVGIPHLPIVLGPDCEFIGIQALTRSAYTDQARCSVRVVMRLLSRIRSLGLYDDSVILLSSDHGLVNMVPRDFVDDRVISFRDLRGVAGSARALLLVKLVHATGPLRVSYAPTSITDVPATVTDALRIVDDATLGTSVFRLTADETRERSFTWYDWREEDWRRDNLEKMELFTITGAMNDPGAWKYGGAIFEPGVDFSDLAVGLFDSETDSEGESFQWTSPRIVLYAPPRTHSFVMPIRSDASVPQILTVTINGRSVDDFALTDDSWHTLEYVLPPIHDAASARIDIYVDPPRLIGRRRLGIMMREVQWRP